VVVREIITFANFDPNRSRDYGIVYIPPTFTIDFTYPRIIYYKWDYIVANYTIVLANASASFEWNITGVTESAYVIDPGDLNPDGPAAVHPHVNATYNVSVVVVDVNGFNVTALPAGNVTTSGSSPTIIYITGTTAPPIGPNSYEADTSDLIQMTSWSSFEPHDMLKEGFYRFSVGGMEFLEGSVLKIEVVYRSSLGPGGGITIEKLLFTDRDVMIDVYSDPPIEVKAMRTVGDTRTSLSPTSESTGPGIPTRFATTSSFTLDLSPPSEDEGTDWEKLGRYAILFVIIGVLLYVILWTSPKRGPEDDAEDIKDAEAETEDELAELEAGRKEVLKEIKEMDRRHKLGEVPKAKWKRGRAELKAELVAIMEDIEDLRSEEASDARARLEERKGRILQELQDLDADHDAGDIPEDEWKERRAELKADAVTVMRELEDQD
jgi:hypothetical protein